MASFIGAAAAASTTVSMPAHIKGDLILVFVGRGATDATISIPAGYTEIVGARITIGGHYVYRVAYKFALSGSETTGTWTNAQHIGVVVYRGLIGYQSVAAGAATSSTISYPAATIGSKAYMSIRAAYHSNNTNLSANTPAGYVQRAVTSSKLRIIDSISPVRTAPIAQNQSVNGSGLWFSTTVTFEATTTEGSFLPFFT